VRPLLFSPSAGFCEAIEGLKFMRLLGAMFLLALVAVAFSLYSDITMTHCKVGSFFQMLGWCSPAY
jgi:hypothetical protein